MTWCRSRCIFVFQSVSFSRQRDRGLQRQSASSCAERPGGMPPSGLVADATLIRQPLCRISRLHAESDPGMQFGWIAQTTPVVQHQGRLDWKRRMQIQVCSGRIYIKGHRLTPFQKIQVHALIWSFTQPRHHRAIQMREIKSVCANENQIL